MHSFNSQSFKSETSCAASCYPIPSKETEEKNWSKEENTRDPFEMIIFNLIGQTWMGLEKTARLLFLNQELLFSTFKIFDLVDNLHENWKPYDRRRHNLLDVRSWKVIYENILFYLSGVPCMLNLHVLCMPWTFYRCLRY